MAAEPCQLHDFIHYPTSWKNAELGRRDGNGEARLGCLVSSMPAAVLSEVGQTEPPAP